MNRQLIEQQRQSHQALVERAKRKLRTASEHLEAAESNVHSLENAIAKAEKALRELPPPHFLPTLKTGSYFPNIYYNDVYNQTAGGAVVDAMAKNGMLCESQADARLISGYLKVLGKLANFVLQANRRSTDAVPVGHGWIIVPKNGDLILIFSSNTSFPAFNSKEDAETVLAKYLTENDKRILSKGI